MSKSVSQGTKIQGQETSALKGLHPLGPSVCLAEVGVFPLPMSQRHLQVSSAKEDTNS